ncbi:hypothetical protein BaRGS_00023578 [Batillaria attramentaria]|uniref:DDE Tnp4 domain-containing protein n=1 Tax=Batillaria attramentaria TaxID=370345 RepID=A0ABD0KDD9_9CAEN
MKCLPLFSRLFHRSRIQQIAQDFQNRWNLPNCIGAMDGKHIEIRSPGGSVYYNYLKYHSIILLALVDARYRFLYIDAGRNGRAGDAGVFNNSTLKTALENNTLNIPAPKALPGTEIEVPHFIVGDDAFPLKPYLMKPYPFRTVADLDDENAEAERRKQRIFDYRLSRARRISENVFGILAARFGVFQTCIRLIPHHATCVTLAAVALHNFLITERDRMFAPANFQDREYPRTHEVIPGDWRQNRQQLDDLQRQPINRSGEDARTIRSKIKEYVNGAGQVPWQERLVFGGTRQ